jgi:hypothetical protein
VNKSVTAINSATNRLGDIARTYSMTVLMSNCVGFCDGYPCAGKSSIWNSQGSLLGQLGGVFEVGRIQISLVPMAVILPPVIGLTLLTRSGSVAAALDAALPSWLVGLQVYRVLGGHFLVLLAFGAVPGAFALPAGTGDVLVGLLALPTAFYLASGTAWGACVAVAWNFLGIADLVTAITLGLLNSPGPQLTPDQPNVVIGQYPTVMTPTFAVPLSMILHNLSLWQLWRRRIQLHSATQRGAGK